MINGPKSDMPGLYYVAVNPSYYFHIENSSLTIGTGYIPYFTLRLCPESETAWVLMNIWYINEQTGIVTVSFQLQ